MSMLVRKALLWLNQTVLGRTPFSHLHKVKTVRACCTAARNLRLTMTDKDRIQAQCRVCGARHHRFHVDKGIYKGVR